MNYVDKQVRQFMEKFDLEAGPAPGDIPIEKLRSTFSSMWQSVGPKPRPMYKTQEIRIPGPMEEIRCRLDVPRESDQLLPVLVYYHGGGCCILTPQDYQGVTTALAALADCIVLTPDFRKAPEHPFPAALDDCFTVHKWLQDSADEIGGDSKRIGVGGDSGGGYLACAVPHEAKREGVAQPLIQIPIYPVTDQASQTRSRQELDAYVNRLSDYLMAELYARGKVLDPRCSPLRYNDFSGLAPAYIITAGLDPLRDEGYAYAAKLRRAGVPVFHHCYEDMIHGFISMAGIIDIGNLAIQHIAGALRNAFGKRRD